MNVEVVGDLDKLNAVIITQAKKLTVRPMI